MHGSGGIMSDRVAIVTGASSGIGEATARKLRAMGYTVYDASLVGFVERVLAESGRVDALVNNAGYGSYGAVEEVPLDEARRQFEVNVFGLARLTQLVLPHMRR